MLDGTTWWTSKSLPGTYLKPTKFLNIPMLADDPAIIQDSEYKLQLAVCTLYETAEKQLEYIKT